ncbi:hypothetical protein [Agromyces salentinus]|uniref:Uncharacterized protein n=1 Tax=Agromyces salentinus TaxID=269421 RepID=A0ABN2MKY1_9MICO|nr:hypothetical protein [Agromyces salentinus]
MLALVVLTRSWPMFAALGAGLVLTAVGAGALGSSGWGTAAAVVLVGSGLAALGWGVAALRAARVPAPGVTLLVSLVLIAASGAVIASGAAPAVGIAVLPLLVADLFVVVVAVGAAATVRSRRGGPTDAASGRPPVEVGAVRGRRSGGPAATAIGMVIGAALVAALATPALAATDAGEDAVPHGELHGNLHGDSVHH